MRSVMIVVEAQTVFGTRVYERTDCVVRGYQMIVVACVEKF